MSSAEQAFIIHRQLAGLCHFNKESSNGSLIQAPLSLQEVVLAARHPLWPRSIETLKHVNTSAVYRAWYKMALSAIACCKSLAQTAASSEDNKLLQRQGEGFILQVTPESRHSQQVYLMIQLSTVTQAQIQEGIFLHCECDSQFYILHLTAPINNRYQLILDTTNPALIAIMKGESELYIS